MLLAVNVLNTLFTVNVFEAVEYPDLLILTTTLVPDFCFDIFIL